MSNKNNESDRICDNLSNLISLYEIIMNAQIQYSQRVWNLFNWFLTIHIGIAGFYLIQDVNSSTFTLIPIIAAIISILWVFIGYQDYKSMDRYNNKSKIIQSEVITKIDCKVLSTSDYFNNNIKSPLISKFRQTWALFVFPVIVLLFWSVLFLTKLQF